MDRREQIQLDRLLPGVGRQILEGSSGRPTRIAKQDIEAAESLGDALHQSGGLLGDGYVGRERSIAASVDRYLRPFFREGVRNGAADAAGPAADERDSS